MEKNSLEYAEWISDQLLYHAVQSIDSRLGNGYHIKNPRLVCEIARITYEEYLRQENLEKETQKINVAKTKKDFISYDFLNNLAPAPRTFQRPKFKFSSFGIPVGAELQCTLNPHIKCTVINGNNGVLYNGKKTSMSEIIRSIKGGSAYRGTQYFTYKGKLLSDMVDKN
jgi:hypothetical protein